MQKKAMLLHPEHNSCGFSHSDVLLGVNWLELKICSIRGSWKTQSVMIRRAWGIHQREKENYRSVICAPRKER
jgi:hypothetical protein